MGESRKVLNLVIQSVTVGAVEMFGGGAAAWRTIAFIYCIIGIITNTLAVFSVKELPDEELKDDRVAGEEDDKFSFKKTIKLLFSNKYFSMICVIYILQQLRAAMVNVGILFNLYIPFIFETSTGVTASAIIKGMLFAHENIPNKFLFSNTYVIKKIPTFTIEARSC